MKFAKTIVADASFLEQLREKRIGFQGMDPAPGTRLSVTAEGCERYSLHPTNTILSMGAFSYSDGFSGRLQASRVRIGRYCSIAAGARTITTNHPHHFISTHPFQYSKDRYARKEFFDLPDDYMPPENYDHNTDPIEIGNDVWIGMSVTIMGGVKIGNGVIVAAGSYVTKDVPDYTIVAGVPAKPTRPRFPLQIAAELNRIAWWNYHYRDLRSVNWSNPAQAISDLEIACASAEPLTNINYYLNDL